MKNKITVPYYIEDIDLFITEILYSYIYDYEQKHNINLTLSNLDYEIDWNTICEYWILKIMARILVKFNHLISFSLLEIDYDENFNCIIYTNDADQILFDELLSKLLNGKDLLDYMIDETDYFEKIENFVNIKGIEL